MALKILELDSNYFFAASVAVAAALVAVAAASVATVEAESTTAAAESTTTAAESTTAASEAGASAFLHDTTVKTATTAKLKNTFFILLYYKRLIINSGQRYKFFNM
jgi:exosome complex RNA-binding protein Rrp42 (RNase PH superfamily)